MEDLTKLLQVLSEDASSCDLPLKLRSDVSARSGLLVFYSILRRGVDVVSDEDSRFGLQLWTDAQIQAVLSFAFLAVSATRSLSVEEVDPLLVAVVQQLLEFAVIYLENSSFESDDLGLQSYFLQLMEIAFANNSEKLSDAPQPLSVEETLKSLSVFTGNSVDVQLDKHMKCNLQGCSWQEKSAGHLVMSLSPDYTQHERQMLRSSESDLPQNVGKLSFLSRHWAIVHIGCMQRLIFLSKNLAIIPFDQKTAGSNFRWRLSLILRILKLLGNLSQCSPYVEYDSALLEACASYVDALPGLLSMRFEFVNSSSITEGSFESLILLLLEEFLHVLQVVFGNTVVFQNVQACIAASILDSLACIDWKYDRCAANVKPPLAYFPRVVVFMLKLIDEISGRTYRDFDWKECDRESMGSCDGLLGDGPSCVVHSEKVHLPKRYTVEELMQLIFPTSRRSLDNLIHLVFFLFSEGVKSGQTLERSYSSCARTSSPSEGENAAGHDEEALFGDLFFEGVRPACSTDDQLPGVINSVSSTNMSLEAASELLNFLKVCIFSPDWHPAIYGDACKTLSSDNISILLSIIDGRVSGPVDRAPGSANVPLEDKKAGHVRELCFGLLHNFLALCALSDSLVDYLVQSVLKVEDGMFVYNGWTLTLLAHTVVSKGGPEGTRLRAKIYKDFISFIVEKAKSVDAEPPSLKELLQSLPSSFHIEILLAAFHLSSQEEKVVFSTSLLRSINEMSDIASGFTSAQLTFWAILVSRLVLLLRHMLFYSKSCPSTLLLDLGRKLKEAPAVGTHFSQNANGNLSSWASVLLGGVINSRVVAEPSINYLINQLIDTVALPVSQYRDDRFVECLILDWVDIHASFSKILGFWKDKKAASVEDLIVERYLFGLCWDMPTIRKATDNTHFLWSKTENLDISDAGHFLQFSHMVLRGFPVQEGVQLWDAAFNVLQQVHDVPLPESPKEIDWNFLRIGMWISLALSMLKTGICMKNEDPGARPLLAENISSESHYMISAVNVISSIVEAGQVAELMRILSSLLNRYLLAFRRFFLFTFKKSEHSDSESSPLLLLLHSAFDKPMQDELLEKSGISDGMFEYVNQLLLNLDVAVNRRSFGFISKALWNFMCHGFPPLFNSPSSHFLCLQPYNPQLNIYTRNEIFK